MNAQGMSSTLEKRLFDSRFGVLMSALDHEILLMPFPPDFRRVHVADKGNVIILDHALAGCMTLLLQLCEEQPLDRMRYFLSLRRLVNSSTHIIALLEICTQPERKNHSTSSRLPKLFSP